MVMRPVFIQCKIFFVEVLSLLPYKERQPMLFKLFIVCISFLRCWLAFTLKLPTGIKKATSKRCFLDNRSIIDALNHDKVFSMKTMLP